MSRGDESRRIRRAGNRSIFEKCRTYTAPDELRAAGLFTFFRTIESGQDPVVMMGGREMVMLGSNNYLGLTSHPKIKEARDRGRPEVRRGLRRQPSPERHARHPRPARGAPRGVHEEARLRHVLDGLPRQPRRPLVPRGQGRHDLPRPPGPRVHLRRRAPRRRRRRQEVQAQRPGRPPAPPRAGGDRSGRMLVIDGVFSMEGDIAPLPEYAEICDDYDMALMVDDAHGVGVLGKHGRGTAEHFGLEDKVDLIMGTFSKSLATVGGFVVGEPDVIKYVKHRARALMFTAAPPPASVAAVLAALDIIESEPERRDRLWENTRFMLTALRAIGFDCGDSSTPVIPIVVGPGHGRLQDGEDAGERGRLRERRREPGVASRARAHPHVLHGDAHAGAPHARRSRRSTRSAASSGSFRKLAACGARRRGLSAAGSCARRPSRSRSRTPPPRTRRPSSASRPRCVRR